MKNLAVIPANHGYKRASPRTSGHLEERVIREITQSKRRALSRLPVPKRSSPARIATLLTRAGISFTGIGGLLSASFRLSAREPYIDGTGYLYLYGALEYIPADDRVIMNDAFSNGGGSLAAIVLHATPGTRYLFDVSASSDGPLTLESNSGFPGASSGVDAQGHAYFVVTGRSDRTAGISLISRSGLYTFHNLVVTKL